MFVLILYIAASLVAGKVVSSVVALKLQIFTNLLSTANIMNISHFYVEISYKHLAKVYQNNIVRLDGLTPQLQYDSMLCEGCQTLPNNLAILFSHTTQVESK